MLQPLDFGCPTALRSMSRQGPSSASTSLQELAGRQGAPSPKLRCSCGERVRPAVIGEPLRPFDDDSERTDSAGDSERLSGMPWPASLDGVRVEAARLDPARLFRVFWAEALRPAGAQLDRDAYTLELPLPLVPCAQGERRSSRFPPTLKLPDAAGEEAEEAAERSACDEVNLLERVLLGLVSVIDRGPLLESLIGV